MSANLVLLRFTIRQIDDMPMPEDPGSMLRGAFGHALKGLSEAAMLFKSSNTSGVFNNNEELAYTTIFEHSAMHAETPRRGIPNPYVLKLPKLADKNISHNQRWEFAQLLIGQSAIQHLSIIIIAWSQALSKGIGGTHKRYKVELEKVMCEDVVLYQGGQVQDFDSDSLTRCPITQNSLIDQQLSTLPEGSDSSLRLRFSTQFRVQHQGKVAYRPEQLDIKLVFYALYNRVKQCQQLHDSSNDWNIGFSDFSEYKQLIEQLSFEGDLSPARLSRHSSRQGRDVTLFGLKGDITVKGRSALLKKLLPILHLGECLHIGKSTVLGLGEYQLKLVV